MYRYCGSDRFKAHVRLLVHDVCLKNTQEDYPKPCITRPNQVLVRIHATTVSTADHRLRALDVPAGFGLPMRLIFGITAPRKHVLGTELAGEVVQVGDHVKDLRPGDFICAHPGEQLGAHAEYIVLSSVQCIKLPESISTRTAAALAFGGTTALHFLRDAAQLTPGERLLVIGAAGSVGSAAVQIGKHLGAHVTGVCGPSNIKLVTETLKADAAIDYTIEGPLLPGTYDVVIDCVGVGNAQSYKHLMATGGALATGGASGAAPAKPPRIVLIAGSLWDLLGMMWPPRGIRVVAGPVSTSPALLQEVVGLCERGAFVPLLNEQTFSLNDIVAAHALVDTGHKRGSVVVDVVRTQ